MNKIFIVKEEGKGINSTTRTLNYVKARPVMEVDGRDAGKPSRLPFSGRTENCSARLLPVMARRSTGCDVDKSCAKWDCHQYM